MAVEAASAPVVAQTNVATVPAAAASPAATLESEAVSAVPGQSGAVSVPVGQDSLASSREGAPQVAALGAGPTTAGSAGRIAEAPLVHGDEAVVATGDTGDLATAGQLDSAVPGDAGTIGAATLGREAVAEALAPAAADVVERPGALVAGTGGAASVPSAGQVTDLLSATPGTEPSSTLPLAKSPAPGVAARVAELTSAWPELGSPDEGRRFAALLDYLVGYDGGSCFAVAPQLAAGGAVGLTAYAVSPKPGEALQKRLNTALGMAVPVKTGTVSKAQCGALNFIRRMPDYPSQDIRIRLQSVQVASGTSLDGRILGDTGRQVHLLIVDDEGRVQKVDNFLTSDTGGYSFTFPVVLTSGSVSTVQLLVAIGAPADLDAISQMDGQLADQYFPVLLREMSARHLKISFAVQAFGVQ
jgi:hypothetical protein